MTNALPIFLLSGLTKTLMLGVYLHIAHNVAAINQQTAPDKRETTDTIHSLMNIKDAMWKASNGSSHSRHATNCMKRSNEKRPTPYTRPLTVLDTFMRRVTLTIPILWRGLRRSRLRSIIISAQRHRGIVTCLEIRLIFVGTARETLIGNSDSVSHHR